jgi:cyclophilin family peptidyl-prolyl cis-trans isomerase
MQAKKITFVCSLLFMLSTTLLAQKTKVEITTEYGKIVMELYDNTPKHRDNMIKLAKEHFYDSTLFHRVIPEFVIQGGDPNSKHATAGQNLGDGEYGSRIPAEINSEDYHKRGAVGMARDNNPEKASSGCQFYLVVGKKYTDIELDMAEKRNGVKYTAEQRNVYKTQGGIPHLDGGYTVFGEVLEGMDVVDKIANEPRNSSDRPNKDIRMLKVRVVKKKFLGIF